MLRGMRPLSRLDRRRSRQKCAAGDEVRSDRSSRNPRNRRGNIIAPAFVGIGNGDCMKKGRPPVAAEGCWFIRYAGPNREGGGHCWLVQQWGSTGGQATRGTQIISHHLRETPHQAAPTSAIRAALISESLPRCHPPNRTLCRPSRTRRSRVVPLPPRQEARRVLRDAVATTGRSRSRRPPRRRRPTAVAVVGITVRRKGRTRRAPGRPARSAIAAGCSGSARSTRPRA